MFERRTRTSLGLLAAPALGLMVLTSGCSSSADDGDDSEEAVTLSDANAALEILPLDIWAQPLPQDELQMTVTHDGTKVRVDDYPATKAYLSGAGQYQIHLAAPMHEPVDVTLTYDGSGDAAGMKLVSSSLPGTGLSIAHAVKRFNGRALETHSLFIGLRHQYFSAQGRPARRGNNVQLMMDGQEAWSTVHKELAQAKQQVNVTTWWWESGFEIVRDPNAANTTLNQRWPNTILGTLEAIPATKRVIVGQFWGQDSILSWLNTDSKLRKYADAPNDNFEFMGQANETKGSFNWSPQPFSFGDRVRASRPEAKDEKFDAEPGIGSSVPGHVVDLSAHLPILQDFADGLLEAASYHQKFMVVNQKVAFVGGMNLRQNDWDTSDHKVFEALRENNDASASSRSSVSSKQSATDNPPRKDYMVRIEGPSVQDADDVFHERWEFLRKTQVKDSQYASDYNVKRDLAAPGSTQLQVTATLPAPFNENAIAETWFNAIRHATKYIYIEDQYFRIPMLDQAIQQRMQQVPDLKLIVITMNVGKTDAACAQSRLAYGSYRKSFPDRAFFYQLRAFDGSGDPSLAFADMDTHAKMLIVDDTFLSVGSCNKNNRGIIYEGELNVAIADPNFVTAARKRIMANILGADPGDDWMGVMASDAAANDQAYSSWSQNKSVAPSLTTHGFPHTLAYPRLDDCYLASVGPDRT